MTLSITPFAPSHQAVFDKLVASTPETSFLLSAPFIVPYSDVNPVLFTIISNAGDSIDIYINNNKVNTVITSSTITQVPLFLNQGRNFVKVVTSFDSKEILVAATNVATLNMAWAEQFYNETKVRLDTLQAQLNSKFSLKQVEHQLIWQDLLPATRVMRILAGKMAIKSLFTMGATDEAVMDISKAITGNTPVVLPTQLDANVWEPDSRLLYSSAHDFSGYEFNIWLFNTCATSWTAFVRLANNLDDNLVKLLSVSDSKVTLRNNSNQIESHLFDFSKSECSIVELLTGFFDVFSKVRVFTRLAVESPFAICAHVYPTENITVENPLGRSRFDQNLPFDSDITLDSCEISDPLCDGLIGMNIGCTKSSTTTTANFVQPEVFGTVIVNVATTSWLSVGDIVFIQNGGTYSIETVSVGELLLKNLGTSGLATGKVVANGSILSLPTQLDSTSSIADITQVNCENTEACASSAITQLIQLNARMGHRMTSSLTITI